MHITINEASALVRRQPSDPRMRNESHFYYRLKQELQSLGHDCIKKEMSKDGHMVSDNVYYVRTRRTNRPDSFMLWDEMYAIRDVSTDFNKNGDVVLAVVRG